MIDRSARAQLSKNLRLLISGKISNDQFEDTVPTTEDAAIQAITEMAGLLYGDMSEHRLVGLHSIEPSDRREALRWILFLDSDFEYRWPQIPLPGLTPMRRTRSTFARWLSKVGALSPKQAGRFLASGDHLAWPFISRAEYKHALRHPKRLAGLRS
ncbi:hypothetical protein [Pleomorphomonas sp. PLEO]|uniref:hypothetical protein n=1 Tax=Pleomorphomonas sp. PLEO TaxID=3239306 RepID=UPI00351DD625